MATNATAKLRRRRFSTRYLTILGTVLMIVSLGGCTEQIASLSTPPARITATLPHAMESPASEVALAPSPSVTQTQPVDEPTETAVPSLSSTVKPNLFPSPPQNRTRYFLNAVLDYKKHALSVEERIIYTNTNPEALSSIALLVEAGRYAGTFRELKIYDRDANRFFQFHLKDTLLTLNLPEKLAPGETTQFFLTYTLQLLDVTKQPRLRPYPLGYTELQSNFGDW